MSEPAAAAIAASPSRPLPRQARQWRSLFLSDLHLGTSRGRPAHLFDFLDHAQSQAIYLVGDIFDGWNPIARRARPLPDHRALLARLEQHAARGTRIVMVPGNHDAGFGRLAGQSLGPIEIREETHHILADGRVFLVTHGHGADPLMALGDTIGWLGGKADILLRRANQGLNALRTGLGGEASTWIEDQLVRLNSALHPSAAYATRLAQRARFLGFHGVICGHYHVPALAQVSGVTYANCGDWLDHFSAVTETGTGALDLVRWPDLRALAVPARRHLPAGPLPAA